MAHLLHRTILRLTGADRVRYLNGQVSANVQTLGHDAGLPACITTAKGKLCADVFITSLSDALLIDADPELREPLAARLDRYIISDDAALEDISNSVALLHLIPAEGVESRSLLPLPCPVEGGSLRLARRYGSLGIDLFVPASEVAAVLLKLGERFQILSDALLEVLRVEAGIPRWGRELDEETLPHEAGLDATHVDYQKGCYIGQEVISRLKSVGHVNRKLCGFASCSPTPGDAAPLLARGMQLFEMDSVDKPAGHLTSAVFSFALAKPIALGYLKRGSPRSGLAARVVPAISNGSASSGSRESIEVAAQELPFIS